jgi:NAD(P)-dependent dehydrogenase (short-subunit alcohol dehydrogenase family)
VAALGGDAYAAGLAGNAADPQHQDDAIALARSRFGGLDYLVNNTGINPVYGPMLDPDPDIARKILDTNVVAAFSVDPARRVAAGLGSSEHPGCRGQCRFHRRPRRHRGDRLVWRVQGRWST